MNYVTNPDDFYFDVVFYYHMDIDKMHWLMVYLYVGWATMGHCRQNDGLGRLYNVMDRIGLGNENGPTSNPSLVALSDWSRYGGSSGIHSRAVTSLRRATEADYAAKDGIWCH